MKKMEIQKRLESLPKKMKNKWKKWTKNEKKWKNEKMKKNENKMKPFKPLQTNMCINVLTLVLREATFWWP